MSSLPAPKLYLAAVLFLLVGFAACTPDAGTVLAVLGDADQNHSDGGDGNDAGEQGDDELGDGFDNDGDSAIDEGDGFNGDDAIDGGIADEDSCSPGSLREVACCGYQLSQQCDEDGHWPPVVCDGCAADAPLGPCDLPDACTVGEERIQRCDDSCIETDTCADDCRGARWQCTAECSWEQVSFCVTYMTPCDPDDTSIQPCGKCGHRLLGCDGCFTDYGVCQDQGVCNPGDSRLAPCGVDDGCEPGRYTTLTCNAACQWDGASACGGCVEGTSTTETQECVAGYACGTRVIETSCQITSVSICQGSATLPVGENISTVVRDDCVNDACTPGQTLPNVSCTTAAGECGTITRLCTDSCAWENQEPCEKRPDACVPGSTKEEVISCNSECDASATYLIQKTCNSAGCGWYVSGSIGECPSCIDPDDPGLFPGRYIKVSNSGHSLPDSASLGSAANEWACTYDSERRLLWEIKTDDGGMRDRDWTYIWYDPTSLGVKGDEQNEFYSHNCEIDDYCNTNNYKNRVNPTSLCGVSTWRIPSLTQLKSLNYCSNSETLGQTCAGDFEYPTIPPEFFPNTKVGEHWTASELDANPPFAWFVTFKYGYESGDYKRYDKSVRLVAIGLDFSP